MCRAFKIQAAGTCIIRYFYLSWICTVYILVASVNAKNCNISVRPVYPCCPYIIMPRSNVWYFVICRCSSVANIYCQRICSERTVCKRACTIAVKRNCVISVCNIKICIKISYCSAYKILCCIYGIISTWKNNCR